jgi:Tol biopolymer transport system component
MKTPSAILGGAVACATLITVQAADLITTGAQSSTGAGHSMAPAVSLDGRVVVFVSHANNLVTNDNLLPFLDVFVRRDGATTLISVDTSGQGGGNGDSSHASVSTNGQFVLFASDANNLVVNDTNGASDVFLHDLRSGTTTLVSANTNGTAAGKPGSESTRPIMTPDGRFVVFESAANDIVPGDTNNLRDLFVRDIQIRTTRLVTVGSAPPFLRPTSASVSADGRRVAFVSPTASVQPEFGPIVNGFYEVYVRDLRARPLIGRAAI